MTSLNTPEVIHTGILPDFQRASAETALLWALESFSPNVALACSFQAEESVLIDMMTGCAPCTRAVKPGEDLRAGHWWWENPETKECGLHIK